jgi:hypothetical protein
MYMHHFPVRPQTTKKPRASAHGLRLSFEAKDNQRATGRAAALRAAATIARPASAVFMIIIGGVNIIPMQ